MAERILRRAEVQAITGLSRSSIYAQMADGYFPRPVRIGKRAVGWQLSQIDRWLNERIARSNRSDEDQHWPSSQPLFFAQSPLF